MRAMARLRRTPALPSASGPTVVPVHVDLRSQGGKGGEAIAHGAGHRQQGRGQVQRRTQKANGVEIICDGKEE